MPRFDFTLDLVVANATLAADGTPIKVGVLVMLGPDGQIAWQSDKAYPLQSWVLDQVAEEVATLQYAAVQGWPELAGACDWWVPRTSDFDARRLLEVEPGDVLGLQD